MDLLRKVERYSLDNGLLSRGDAVVVGVSGGADSVCLLRILCALREKYDLRLTAVHVQHGIRGEAAERDARFVEELCGKLGVACRIVRRNIPAEAARFKISEEEAGRAARYQVFAKVAAKFGEAGTTAGGAVKIAVAHNQNDNAETFLFHAFRGSGLTGLRGILPLSGGDICAGIGGGSNAGTDAGSGGGSNAGTDAGSGGESNAGTDAGIGGGSNAGTDAGSIGGIIRPLLCASRAEIEEYLAQQGFDYVEDETNGRLDYVRNRIRNRILPQAEELVNRRAAEHLARTAEELARVAEFVRQQAREAYGKVLLEERAEPPEPTEGQAGQAGHPYFLRISLEKWAALPEVLRDEVLLCAIERLAPGRRDIGRAHVLAARGIALGETGRRAVLPYRITVVRSYGNLEFVCRRPEQRHTVCAEEASFCFEVPPLPFSCTLSCGEFSLCLREYEKKAKIPKNCYTKWFDYDKIVKISDGLLVRTRQAGDYMVIHEDGRRKSLKSLLIDRKIPQDERGRIPLLAAGSRVLWAVGVRSEEGLYVDENTKRILVAELRK